MFETFVQILYKETRFGENRGVRQPSPMESLETTTCRLHDTGLHCQALYGLFLSFSLLIPWRPSPSFYSDSSMDIRARNSSPLWWYFQWWAIFSRCGLLIIFSKQKKITSWSPRTIDGMVVIARKTRMFFRTKTRFALSMSGNEKFRHENTTQQNIKKKRAPRWVVFVMLYFFF